MLTAFYLLLRNNDTEIPYLMGKVYSTSKDKAAEIFLQTFKTPKNWYTHEELLHATKEENELSDKERFWLEKEKTL